MTVNRGTATGSALLERLLLRVPPVSSETPAPQPAGLRSFGGAGTLDDPESLTSTPGLTFGTMFASATAPILVSPTTILTSSGTVVGRPARERWYIQPTGLVASRLAKLMVEPVLVVVSASRRHEEAATAKMGSVTGLMTSPTVAATGPPDFLTRRVELAFRAAQDERFEEGMESQFSRTLASLIKMYGNPAVAAIERRLGEASVSAEVASETLRLFGEVSDLQSQSQKYRLRVLRQALRSPAARLRYAAALGLAALDDTDAIEALVNALRDEKHESLKQIFRLALDQLEQTLRCPSS